MAKTKLPKKTNAVNKIAKEPVTAPTIPVPASDANIVANLAAAAPVPETIKTEPVKTETKRAARKPEIVRTEPRANLVPINIEEEIRRFAYLLSERRGFEPGHEAEDWLAAEHEVRQRYHQQSA